MVTSEYPPYSLALLSSFICTCTTTKKIEFASKRTLGHFPKNSAEHANKWLVSGVAVRAETVNITAHRVGFLPEARLLTSSYLRIPCLASPFSIFLQVLNCSVHQEGVSKALLTWRDSNLAGRVTLLGGLPSSIVFPGFVYMLGRVTPGEG